MSSRISEEDLAAIVAKQKATGFNPATPAKKKLAAETERESSQLLPLDPKQSKSVFAKAQVKLGPAGMNKTETRYFNDFLYPQFLARKILRAYFDRVRRKLSVHGEVCWLKTDFEVLTADGFIEYHEVKGGHITEDAQVKFKCAMEQYPEYGWLMWQWKGGEWRLIKDSRKIERARLNFNFP